MFCVRWNNEGGAREGLWPFAEYQTTGALPQFYTATEPVNFDVPILGTNCWVFPSCSAQFSPRWYLRARESQHTFHLSSQNVPCIVPHLRRLQFWSDWQCFLNSSKRCFQCQRVVAQAQSDHFLSFFSPFHLFFLRHTIYTSGKFSSPRSNIMVKRLIFIRQNLGHQQFGKSHCAINVLGKPITLNSKSVQTSREKEKAVYKIIFKKNYKRERERERERVKKFPQNCRWATFHWK